MMSSRSSRGEKLVWPPSEPSAIQPSSAGKRAGPPRPPPFGAQPRQGHRQRSEVVDNDQRIEFQPLAHLGDRELPVVVGHAHRVAHDRVGDGDGRVVHVGVGHARQVGADGGVKVGIVGAAQRLDMFEAARPRHEREASVGAADVGDELRAGGGVHGGRCLETVQKRARRTGRDGRRIMGRRSRLEDVRHKPGPDRSPELQAQEHGNLTT